MKPNEQRAWIEQMAPAAQASQTKYGVLASITLAQAILESGWGKYAIGNNYFGIKARQGEDYCDARTTEFVKGQKIRITARFRKFRTVQECFERHGELLATAKCYRPAMAVSGDPLAFALQLQRCGYATDPKYAQKLTDLIRDFDLTKFDAVQSAALKELA
jgi:flagellum-specific peptidoglycan hydrolase FlgJ